METKISASAEGVISTVSQTYELKTDAASMKSTLESQISQTAEQIKLKVSKGKVSSELSVESGQVIIKSNRFVLESTNCSISADGTIKAKNAELSGKITAISGTIAGFTITQNSIYAENQYTSISISPSGIKTGTSASGYTAEIDAYGYAKLSDLKIKNRGEIKFLSQYGTLPDVSVSYSGISFNVDGFPNIMFNNSSGGNLFKIGKDKMVISSGSYDVVDSVSAKLMSFAKGKVCVGDTSSQVGFFGNAGSAKKTVSTITTPSSATAATIASKVNELINALKAYNLIG